MAAAAYGSLFLEKGESMPKAEEQIDAFVGVAPVAIYFDVTGTEWQRALGEECVKRITRYCEERLPDVPVTCSFSIA